MTEPPAPFPAPRSRPEEHGAAAATGGLPDLGNGHPGSVDRLYFEGSRFEVSSRTLLHGGTEVPLRPKTADVLAMLLANAGEVVTKQALLAEVWPDGFVGDEVLAGCISELRGALGDDAKDPRFIATAHRRGYRFVAHVSPTPPSTGAPDPDELLVGREDELAELAEWFQAAQRGEPTVGFITAAAGVGKSTLVDAFVADVRLRERVLIGRGHCVEQFGGGEPYLPFLDALAALCRGADGASVREVLRAHAPLWMLQLPGLLAEGDVDELRRRTAEASPDRMMRELAGALEAISSVAPTVLVCEDVHAADRPTVELLGYLARYPRPTRLLVLCTYRPADAAVRSHPVRTLVADLRSRRRCRHLALELLAPAAVGAYLARRLAPATPSPSLVEEVYRRTEGNALFTSMLVDYLVERDLLQVIGQVVGYREKSDRLEIPDTVRDFIGRQLDELTATDLQLAGIAAAAGVEFATETVLAAAGGELPELSSAVEDRLAALAHDFALLSDGGVVQWPDGTVTSTYRFPHTVYQEQLYARLSPARRAAIHRRIGRRLEAGYGARSGEIAAELAMHFERGHDDERAVRYLAVAAGTALERAARAEALDYASRGLELLRRTPALADRAGELRLRMTQTVALATERGFGAPEVDAAYWQALDACAEVDDVTLLAPVLFGLWNVALARGNAGDAERLAELLDGLSRQHDDPLLDLQANNVAGFTAWVAGRPVEAAERLERCQTLYDPDLHHRSALSYGEDPGVGALRWGAVVTWVLGASAEARRLASQAVRVAEHLGYPTEVARAASYATGVHVLCRDVEGAARFSDVLAEVAERYDLPAFASIAQVYGGWVMTHRGDPERGVAQMRDRLAEFDAWVLQGGRHFFTSLLAEVLDVLGDTEAALATATEALDMASRAGQRWYEAEQVRMCGELALRAGRTSSAEAEARLVEALDIARRQQAKGFELRAATSVARMWRDRGETARARELLERSLGGSAAGDDTGDVQVATRLLSTL